MKITKTLILAALGFLMMGNQSCEKPVVVDAGPKTRELKYIVDVGLVKSAIIEMPGGQQFDFEFVLNQQMYPVLQKSEGFWFRYKPPFGGQVSQLGSQIEFKNVNLSKNDLELFERSFAGKVKPPTVLSEEISCLVDLPQYRLTGTVNSFELLSRNKLGLGFTPSGNIGSGMLGINFQVETYQLDINMVAEHPITAGVVAAVNVPAKQTRTQFDFSLPLGNLFLDPSFYHSTPLARVSFTALENAVKQIREQIRTGKLEWHTRVLYADEHAVAILAGKSHNVQVGDTFNIYNERTMWGSRNGEVPVPCESQYYGSTDGDPVAVVEVFEISDETATAKVVKTSGLQIKMGAKVKVQSLVAPPAVAIK